MASENEYENTAPYNKIVEGKWFLLELSPIGKIIEHRFTQWYDGKLTWREINNIKENMDRCKIDIDKYKKETYDDRHKLIESIKEQKKLCNDECLNKLEDHLKICDSAYKCTKNYVANQCQSKENGRCSHYYELEHLNEKLDNYEYYIDTSLDSYSDYEASYDRALAIKENRYDEYKRDLDDYFS